MTDRTSSRRYTAVVGFAILAAACSSPSESGAAPVPPDGAARTIQAIPFVQVAPDFPDSPFGGTTLEGPTFGPDGNLYLVNASTDAGQPKVFKVDMATKQATGIFTDETSMLASAQFSPTDGRLYVTDFTSGGVLSMKADASDVKTVFNGEVAPGDKIIADDMTFDPSGAMFLADASGTFNAPTGRIVGLNPDGTSPTVLTSGLASVNGIAFNPDFSKLWISEYSSSQVDSLALNADHTAITDGSVGFRPSELGTTSLDSIAVDSAGNIYQAIWEGSRILVWSPEGEHIATILPTGVPAAKTPRTTNLAIKPGTTEGYLTASGPAGGWLYQFTALANGATQSNGG